MFTTLFNAGASTPRAQPLDFNRSARPIPETSSAGGHGYVDRLVNDDGLDESVNNTLGQEFSKLTIDDPSPAPYICPTVEPFARSVPVPPDLEQQQAVHVLTDAEELRASCQAIRQAEIEVEDVSSKPGHEDLLSKAEEALRCRIVQKTNKLYIEQGPDLAKAFLSALCTLSTESFDHLCASVLHVSTSFDPTTPSASDAGSTLPGSSKNGKSGTGAGKKPIRDAKLEKFTANAVGALIQFVNSHWERLAVGLEPQGIQRAHSSVNKRMRRLYHHLELRSLEQEAELHWLRRALALIRNVRDFEEYLGEKGYPLSEGSNQRLRHAYLVEIYAADSSRPDLNATDIKTAFKEDLRYAVRWMIFIKTFGLGAIIVCGEGISKLVYKTSGNNNGDLEWLATRIQQLPTINVQALCDIFHMLVADMIEHYRVEDHLNKSELIEKIQTVVGRDLSIN